MMGIEDKIETWDRFGLLSSGRMKVGESEMGSPSLASWNESMILILERAVITN